MDERVRELLDRVRDTAVTVGEAAGTTARYAAKYAGQTVDIAKLNMKIFDLKTDINALLREIGQELAAGNIAADPFWRGPEHNACQWCAYAAACHFEEGKGGDRKRWLPAVKGEAFWEAVAQEQG